MPIVNCEICGLRTSRVKGKKRTFMAQFPLDEDRCKQWVKITGKEDLAYVPIEKLHQLKHICGQHFRPNDFKKKKTQLRRNAIPCIGIIAQPLSYEILRDFPLHLKTKKAVEDQHLQFNATHPSIPQCSKDTVTVTYEYTRKKHTTDNIHMSDHSYSNSFTDMNLASGDVCNVNTLQAIQELRHEFGGCLYDIRRDIGELRSTMEGIMHQIGGLESRLEVVELRQWEQHSCSERLESSRAELERVIANNQNTKYNKRQK